MTHLPVGAVVVPPATCTDFPACHSERSEESVPTASGLKIDMEN